MDEAEALAKHEPLVRAIARQLANRLPPGVEVDDLEQMASEQAIPELANPAQKIELLGYLSGKAKDRGAEVTSKELDEIIGWIAQVFRLNESESNVEIC